MDFSGAQGFSASVRIAQTEAARIVDGFGKGAEDVALAHEFDFPPESQATRPVEIEKRAFGKPRNAGKKSMDNFCGESVSRKA